MMLCGGGGHQSPGREVASVIKGGGGHQSSGRGASVTREVASVTREVASVIRGWGASVTRGVASVIRGGGISHQGGGHQSLGSRNGMNCSLGLDQDLILDLNLGKGYCMRGGDCGEKISE